MVDTARQLTVWLLGTPAGTLAQVDGRLQFTYLPTAKLALSQSLPLRAEPFDDRASRPFFAGLLPEGSKRRQIAKTLPALAQTTQASLELQGHGHPIVGAIVALIAQRCALMIRRFV